MNLTKFCMLWVFRSRALEDYRRTVGRHQSQRRLLTAIRIGASFGRSCDSGSNSAFGPAPYGC